MRGAAAIVLVSLCVAACGGSSEPRQASASAAPAPAAAAVTDLACMPWPEPGRPPEDPRLARSPEQDLPGTESGFSGAPVRVTVGLACVTSPSGSQVAGLFCGAGERGTPPRACMVGEECGVGSIMVTEVSRYQESDGVATCAVFENWSPNRTRTISLWVRTR